MGAGSDGRKGVNNGKKARGQRSRRENEEIEREESQGRTRSESVEIGGDKGGGRKLRRSCLRGIEQEVKWAVSSARVRAREKAEEIDLPGGCPELLE